MFEKIIPEQELEIDVVVRIPPIRERFVRVKVKTKEVLDILSTAKFRDHKFEVFIVMGDPPDYDNVKIINLTNGKTYQIKHKQDFIDWLEFKKELE